MHAVQTVSAGEHDGYTVHRRCCKKSLCLTTCMLSTRHREVLEAKCATLSVQSTQVVAECVTHVADFIVPAPS
jgi:hypothetical protein